MTLKTNFLSATALSITACLLVACDNSSTLPESDTTVDSAVIETIATEAETSAQSEQSATAQQSATPTNNSEPTVQRAKEFLEQAEEERVEFGKYALQTYWVNANFITPDTIALAARVSEEGARLSTRHANQAKRFNGLKLPTDMRRKMDGLLRGSNFPAPDDSNSAKNLAEIMVRMESTYGAGTFPIDVANAEIIEILDVDPDGEKGPLEKDGTCLLYTSPSPRDQRGSRMPSSA